MGLRCGARPSSTSWATIMSSAAVLLWCTTATLRANSFSPTLAMLRPRRNTFPREGARFFVMRPNSVDFPQPFAPITQVTLPCSTSRLAPRSTLFLP